jgi:hypothetical protein
MGFIAALYPYMNVSWHFHTVNTANTASHGGKTNPEGDTQDPALRARR